MTCPCGDRHQTGQHYDANTRRGLWRLWKDARRYRTERFLEDDCGYSVIDFGGEG